MSIYDYTVIGGVTLIDPAGYIEMSRNINHHDHYQARLYRAGVKRGELRFTASDRREAFDRARRELAPENHMRIAA